MTVSEAQKIVRAHAAQYAEEAPGLNIYDLTIEALVLARDQQRLLSARSQAQLAEAIEHRPSYAPGPTRHERGLQALIAEGRKCVAGYDAAILLRRNNRPLA